MQEPLAQPGLGAGVEARAALDAEAEGPEQLGDADEEIAFGEVDTGADAAAGTVAVVVAVVGGGVGGR